LNSRRRMDVEGFEIAASGILTVTHSEIIHDDALIYEREARKIQRQRVRERFDRDTRIFRTHVHRCSLSHTIKHTLTPHRHRRRVCYCSKGEQPPSASGYARIFFARQLRAASCCAALWAHRRPQGRSKTASTSTPLKSVETLKWMRAESACKSAAEHVTNKTLELLRYSAHFSGIC
jgi:hypothetical protein